jgi:hypothetical protein
MGPQRPMGPLRPMGPQRPRPWDPGVHEAHGSPEAPPGYPKPKSIETYIILYSFIWFLLIFISNSMVLDGFYGFLYQFIWFWMVFMDFYIILYGFGRFLMIFMHF